MLHWTVPPSRCCSVADMHAALYDSCSVWAAGARHRCAFHAHDPGVPFGDAGLSDTQVQQGVTHNGRHDPTVDTDSTPRPQQPLDMLPIRHMPHPSPSSEHGGGRADRSCFLTQWLMLAPPPGPHQMLLRRTPPPLPKAEAGRLAPCCVPHVQRCPLPPDLALLCRAGAALLKGSPQAA